VDDTGILQKIYASGDPKGNLEKSGKRKQTPESRKEEFDTAFDIESAGTGSCTIEDLMSYLDLSERTIRQRLSDFKDEYVCSKGNVMKLQK
jgi:hypothetical protein